LELLAAVLSCTSELTVKVLFAVPAAGVTVTEKKRETPPVPFITTPCTSVGVPVIAGASAIMLRAFLAHHIPPRPRRGRTRGEKRVELALHLVQRERTQRLRRLFGGGAPSQKGCLDVPGDFGLLAAPADE